MEENKLTQEKENFTEKNEEGIVEEINEDKSIQERKEKVLNYIKKKNLWVLGILLIAIILGVYIRSLPMQDHGGRPGLWDITTNTWTLGPDLDPFLFLRSAETIVEKGYLPKRDYMRNVPRGFDNSIETQLLPYMLVWTYDIISLFKSINIEYAAAIFPVLIFIFTIIFFYLFVREIFIENSKREKIKANIIALISTFLMIVIPIFLSRTVAGIPEKEAPGFMFLFLSFYLILKSWKIKNLKKSLFVALLAGITTALMGLVWGGVIYIFITIGIANLFALILGKIKTKEALIYIIWMITYITILTNFSNKYSLSSMFLSTSDLIVGFTLFLILIDNLLWKTSIKLKLSKFEKKIPRQIITLIISIILGVILVSIVFGPEFIPNKINGLIQTFIKPITGRWNITVAENRQPYFKEWVGSFGPFILKNIPLLFWMFFIGSIFFFKDMLKNLKELDSLKLTAIYIFFFFGLVFSRYSGDSIFNGENFISELFYYGSALTLFVSIIYYYIKYYKEKNTAFNKIKLPQIFLFGLFVLAVFSARSAVRLIMVLGPISTIFASYLVVELGDKYLKSKDETKKIIFAISAIIAIIGILFLFSTFFKIIKVQSYSYIPSSYTQQWQKAMQWVRDETPQNAVFAHWWDYGYWVQTIGKRATVLDGGNAITYWNYLMGRLVLTGDNQKDALEFLYTHNATHLLIDSTDIGKYTAFSSIGSNEDYDRYSWIGSYIQDPKQVLETKNKTIYYYLGGTMLDEDLILNEGKPNEILLPRQRAGIGAIVLTFEKKENGTTQVKQPEVIAVYQQKQYRFKLRYIDINGKFIDFKQGVNGTAYIIPQIIQQPDGRIRENPIGVAVYISPRLMRGLLSNIYFLNDPMKKFTAFKLAHTEPNLMIDSLRSQGMQLPDFVYYNGVQGPIKIWEINYTGNEKINPDYLDTDYRPYISWKL